MKRLADLERADMLRALEECDALGRDEFLRRHGFSPSKRFFIRHNRRLYDSKAIVGVASGRDPSMFSGGRATIGPVCKRTGFVLEEK